MAIGCIAMERLSEGDSVYQDFELTKAKDGVLAEELRRVLLEGQNLIGPEYLKRMRENGLIGDVSFVAEIAGGVYLISYYLFKQKRNKPTTPLSSSLVMRQYMSMLDPFFEGSVTETFRPANSFWISASIPEKIGD